MQRDWKTAVETLTERERECLTLLGEGMSQKEVAQKLCRSTRTVEGFVENIRDKTGLRKTSQLVRVAVAAGLVPVEFEVAS